MTLIKYHKAQPRMFSNLFDSFFNEDFFDHLEAPSRTPATNVMENDKEVGLQMRVPGFNKDQIKIEVENNTLKVSGTVNAKKESKEEGFTRKEFSLSNFERSFKLPENLDSEKITAKHENGVLNIVIPKLVDEKKKKRLVDIF